MEDAEDAADSPAVPSQHALDELRLAPGAVLDALPDAVVAAAADERIVYANQLAAELFGYRREAMLGQPVAMLWPERLRELYTQTMRQLFSRAEPFRFTTEAWGLTSGGREFPGEMSFGIVNTTDGRLLLAIGRDLSARRAADARLRAIATMGERALAGADPALLSAEASLLLMRTLPIAGVQLRLSDGAVLVSAGNEMPGEPMRLPIGSGDELIVAPERPLEAEEMSTVHAVASILATALARLQKEQRMRYDAVHDPLTGVANRALLRDRLEHALARAAREAHGTGVLYLDLDRFKAVNDSHGHATGDSVLVEFARRLVDAVRPADTVARMGGDEFVVICEEIDEPRALALAERLLEALAPVHVIGSVEITLRASIGVAVGQGPADVLLAAADAALYRAKESGGGRACLSPGSATGPTG